jgi:hypothetical protein
MEQLLYIKIHFQIFTAKKIHHILMMITNLKKAILKQIFNKVY